MRMYLGAIAFTFALAGSVGGLPVAAWGAPDPAASDPADYAYVYFVPFPDQRNYQQLTRSNDQCHSPLLPKIIGMVGNSFYPNKSGPFRWKVGERFYFHVLNLRRAVPEFYSCNNISSFVPERGKKYYITQQLGYGQGGKDNVGKILDACMIHVVDESGQSPETYVAHPLGVDLITGSYCKPPKS